MRAMPSARPARVRGPLHGVPILLKDNIDATPMVNSAGSLALAAHRPRTDAFLVARLREAGAVILGKTNLSEWANFRSSRSTSGWSARGGQTRNPYALDRNRLRLQLRQRQRRSPPASPPPRIGTETDGSIICPSSVAGLVGIKPTVGLVSRNGIIPISHSQDTAGPMARSVADAAALLVGDRRPRRRRPRRPPKAPAARCSTTTRASTPTACAARASACCARPWASTPTSTRRSSAAIEAMRKAGAEVVDVEIADAGPVERRRDATCCCTSSSTA